MVKLGIDRLPRKARPEKNYFWRGGHVVDTDGYILKKVPMHPYRTSTGYVRLHRLVMEESLGRLLLPGEVVDHRNADKSDNRIENLQLFASNADHLRQTLTGTKKLEATQREKLRRQAVRVAKRRVRAILEGTGSDVGR